MNHCSLYVICCFPLSAYKILPLSLGFSSLNVMCLDMVFFVFILFGVCWAPCICICISSSRLWKILASSFQKKFFPSPPVTPITCTINWCCLTGSWGFLLRPFPLLVLQIGSFLLIYLQGEWLICYCIFQLHSVLLDPVIISISLLWFLIFFIKQTYFLLHHWA